MPWGPGAQVHRGNGDLDALLTRMCEEPAGESTYSGTPLEQARAAAAQRAPMALRRDVAPKTGKKVGWLCRFGWFATDPLLLEPGETQCTVSMRLWAQVQEMPRQAPIACTPQCVT